MTTENLEAVAIPIQKAISTMMELWIWTTLVLSSIKFYLNDIHQPYNSPSAEMHGGDFYTTTP